MNHRKSIKTLLAASLLSTSLSLLAQTYTSDASEFIEHTVLKLDLSAYSSKQKEQLGKMLACKDLLPPYTKRTPFFGGRSSKKAEEKLLTLSEPVRVYGTTAQHTLVSYMGDQPEAGELDGVIVFLDKNVSLKQFVKANQFEYDDGSHDNAYKSFKMPKNSADRIYSHASVDPKWGGVVVMCGIWMGT